MSKKHDTAQTLINNATLGRNNTDIALSSLNDCQLSTLRLIQSAGRHILLFSHALDNRLYDNIECIDALSLLARSHQYSTIKILVSESQRVVKKGHRVIELARRLSSKFEIRRTNEEFTSLTHEFTIADDIGMIYRPHFEQYQGVANFNCPLAVAGKKKLFNDIWERSEVDPELRRLHL